MLVLPEETGDEGTSALYTVLLAPRPISSSNVMSAVVMPVPRTQVRYSA